ncbi:MAG: hypothetical protein ACLULM_06220 [Acutalibacter sp.]
MITLLTGKKGSGKTKKLIEMANAALEKTNGNVVVVEKGLKLTYDISHAARLIDIDAYDVKGGKGLYGFLAGICAGNYDVTDILVDSTLKITGTGAEVMDLLVNTRRWRRNPAPTSCSPFPLPTRRSRVRAEYVAK